MQATQQAFDQIQAMKSEQGMPPEKALRIAVEDGGCSGRQYVIKFDDMKDDDIVVGDDLATRIIVDPVSHELIKDCEIDYVDTLSDTGFKIRNPLAKRSCGCGKSFEV
ncbi:iron-sulfur cluster assembly accessory protein [Kamptonema cortianum]|uniref:Iron-sulfur cluster assembly accessory protein n=1 Tax=Geitlerinema calcuttense NRMC-F 0142 TaxID=2922238 RepID=A0ABT7LZR2_9CYAN|nr:MULTISPECIES: iron-sulfur cluster assembly accessory protein [Cyanophyceae]MDK3156627.1 iron-sulfur cluster assembly accessory protein [Kamptonema cortianum]MDL5050363.1 iron-sulfur cluster assembly accessory protein [Oscillatoria amoena NRMC-F 0135]MDL5053366.1 iron-sulfur cluster assembly accessory protein [Oscillatoria laete-virens NRMC-F 0139]MDL5056585.1 iron-sulfur cluster assembly accessory protein [Geitlerinema calcuttense NRMC-F 0142]